MSTRRPDRTGAPRRRQPDLIARAGATAAVDALEPRRLFTATIEVTRTLVISGTPGDDQISVDLDVIPFGGSFLRVTENGTVSGSFPLGQVADVLILCGDGNDFVRIGSGGFFGSVTTPTQIEGGNGGDEINAGAGNDTIFGGDGDDFITGYAGNDFIDAGAGNDVVIVHVGNDTVFGGPGDDQLNGQETGKNSTFDGGDGNDTIIGTSRRDTILGGLGDDVIDGGRGADRVFGGDGNDRITINQRSARLFGDGGADIFIGRGRGRRGARDFTDGLDSIQPAAPLTPIVNPVATPSDSVLGTANDLLD